MQLEVLEYIFLCLRSNNSEWLESYMVVHYLLITIYNSSRGPNTKDPGIFTWKFHWCLRDFAIRTSPDLAASNRCPFDPRRRPAINAFRRQRRRHRAFPGESVPVYHVHLISVTSSRRIAALRSTAVFTGGRISDCPCATHLVRQFSCVEIRIAADLRQEVFSRAIIALQARPNSGWNLGKMKYTCTLIIYIDIYIPVCEFIRS